MTEPWLKQPKMLPCPALLLLSAKKLGCINHHKTLANTPSLTGAGICLDQVKYTYACLTAFIMTEHWLKQPKMLPCLSVVECQTMKMHQPPQCSYK